MNRSTQTARLARALQQSVTVACSLLVLSFVCVLSGCGLFSSATTTQPRQTNYARSVSQLKAFDRLSSTIYATNFSWWDSTGKVHELREYFGRPIIVHFWNSTCTQCIATQSLYSRLATEFRDSNLTIVNVLMREGYPADSAVERLQHVVDSLQIPYQEVIGTNELAYTYGGIDVIPTDVFIAPDAHVVGSMIGTNNTYESMRNVLLKSMRPGGK